MEDEVVRRRGWLTREELLDLLGAASLIPGPNSTELAIHIGHRRAGWPGLLIAGLCFIVPAALIVSLIAFEHVFGFAGLFLSFPFLFVAGRIRQEFLAEELGQDPDDLFVAPGIPLTIQSAPGGVFPLGLSGQAEAVGPGHRLPGLFVIEWDEAVLSRKEVAVACCLGP